MAHEPGHPAPTTTTTVPVPRIGITPTGGPLAPAPSTASPFAGIDTGVPAADGTTVDAAETILQRLRAGGKVNDLDFRKLSVTIMRGGKRQSVPVTQLLDGREAGERLSQLQQRLFQGNFYPSDYYKTTNPRRPNFGHDEPAFRQAYKKLLVMASMNKRQTVSEILDANIQSFRSGGTGGNGVTLRDAVVGGGGNYEVQLPSIAGLEQVADQVAESVLGRKATAEEKAKYSTRLRAFSQSQQQAGIAAQEGTNRQKFGLAQEEATNRAAVTAANGGGGLLNPLGEAGSFTDTMGADRDGGTRRHKGTDIFAPMGAPVYAPVSGKITVAGVGSGGSGLRVWIAGDDGRHHYLAHLNSLEEAEAIVARGGRVEAGAVIGTNGDSGNAKGGAPHVHYSINSKQGSEDAVGNPALELGKVKGGGVVMATADSYIAPVVTTTEQIDPEAEAAKELRIANPEEAKAHDVNIQYRSFRQFLNNPGAVPA